ncbi:C39 family peptidase [Candidatus Woesebacteria bacterium]|nr:C39 family peptidase [Candidatus Woesebacteria bacterium]
MKSLLFKLSIIIVFLYIISLTTTLIGRVAMIPEKHEQNEDHATVQENVVFSPPPTIAIPDLPTQKILSTSYHTFQTFNNCGPASLSMTLRLYGISVSQQELGQSLRPYQVASGDNDDKSVTLSELAKKSSEYGFTPYHRPLGTRDILKKAIALDIPVIVRTLTKPSEDIGHFRVIKGYDETLGIVIQDDSLQGKDLQYSYDELDRIWKPFNFEYLLLVPQNKIEQIEVILGDYADEKTAWEDSVRQLEDLLLREPEDNVARFNLSVALFHVGDYERSIQEYEKVEQKLPQKTLWYQIEPILAYEQIGNAKKVFEITEKIIRSNNRAYSELYMIRGRLYKAQGNIEAARNEFKLAVLYNRNLAEAQEALQSL